MTILELIIAQCLVQGVDRKHAERIEKISGITEEKDGNIIAAVKSFKENVIPAIEEAEKEAKEKAEKEAEKKKTDDPEEKDKSKEPELPANLDPSVKAFIESQKKSMEEMTEMMSNLITSQKTSSNLALIKEKLKGKVDEKFIEKYAKKANLEAEDIEAEVERVAKEFTDDKQAFLNEAVSSGNYQPASGGITDTDFDDYVKRTETPESEFEGKKI